MKTISFILLVLICTAVTAQRRPAPPPAPQNPKLILFDFRVTRAIASPKISPATERNVLSKVFRKYLSDESKCNSEFDPGGSTDPLLAARKAGQMVPSIVDMASGSFTALGRQETIYVISVSECNASHADNFGSKRVAIFSGSQLVAEMDDNFRSSIVRKVDLNGDGIDELLMAGGDMNMGTATEMAALVDFRGGRLHVIEDFGTVSLDSCASELRGSSAKASVISFADVLPGLTPKLKMSNYIATCRAPTRWRLLSTGKMPE